MPAGTRSWRRGCFRTREREAGSARIRGGTSGAVPEVRDPRRARYNADRAAILPAWPCPASHASCTSVSRSACTTRPSAEARRATCATAPRLAKAPLLDTLLHGARPHARTHTSRLTDSVRWFSRVGQRAGTPDTALGTDLGPGKWADAPGTSKGDRRRKFFLTIYQKNNNNQKNV